MGNTAICCACNQKAGLGGKINSRFQITYPTTDTQAEASSSTVNNEVPALAVRPAFLFQSAIALTEQVELNSGPERFCINRWQPQLQRDYFIGRNRQGQWLWLYRTAELRWFVQGMFS